MLAPLRRCVDGWPCMVGDLRGRKMRTGSKIENPSTSLPRESRELQLLLFNFLCNLNRAAYKCSAEKWVTSPAPAPYRPGSFNRSCFTTTKIMPCSAHSTACRSPSRKRHWPVATAVPGTLATKRRSNNSLGRTTVLGTTVSVGRQFLPPSDQRADSMAVFP